MHRKHSIMRNLFQHACLLASTAAAMALLVSAASAGPVILGGDDLTDHGSTSHSNCAIATLKDGWLYIHRAILNLQPNVTRPGNDGSIAALGASSSTATSSNAGAAIRCAAQKAGIPVTFHNGATAISQFFADLVLGNRNPAIIWIAGDHVTNSLDSTEITALKNNAQAIADFVNSGGGLMSHTHIYTWLSTAMPGLGVQSICDSNGATLTADGKAAFPGLTDANIRSGPCHNHFTGNFGDLKVLARDGSSAQRPFIIGGAASTIFGQISLAPVTAVNVADSEHTLTATLKAATSPFGPLANTLVTFKVVSGPNIGVTGTAMSDALGRAVFTYAGTGGPGTDQIRASFVAANGTTQQSNLAAKEWRRLCDTDGDNVVDRSDMTAIFNGVGESLPFNDPRDAVPDGLLTVNDARACVLRCDLSHCGENSAPVARAGADQAVLVRDTVVLDGSASFDPNGDPLEFSWAFSEVPQGSTATLSDPAAVQPSFVAELPGMYLVQLTVRDGAVIGTDMVAVTATLPLVLVPDLTGTREEDALATLAALRLSAGVVARLFSTSIPEGQVVGQDPTGGTYAPEETVVALVVSAGSAPVVVPDVVGLSEHDAEHELKHEGLERGAVSRETHATIPAGLVISQSPQAGAAVPGGTTVDIVVSLGAPVTVPDVLGMARPDAERAITLKHLFVGPVTEEHNAAVPAGAVAAQNPPGGTSVAAGSEVELVISLGAAPVAVPDISGMSRADAEAAITAGELAVGTVTESAHATVPEGTVASQDPAAGESVPAGTRVNFVVSLGPTVRIPDLRGLTQSQALATITTLGLSVGTITRENNTTIAADQVIRSNPPAGSSADAGSAVALVISSGPAPVTVPDVTGLPRANAAAAIVASDLRVGTVTEAASATIPAGAVISQSPAPGTTVLAGSEVALVESAGAIVTLTALTGLTRSEAESAITAAGLAVGTVTLVESTVVPRGYVVEQNPEAGSAVPLGGAVDLIISAGPAVRLPQLGGLTEESARAAIIAAGLVVGEVSRVESFAVVAGRVISQEPAGETVLLEGSAVNLVISLGPPANSDLSRPAVFLTADPPATLIGATLRLRVTATDPQGVVATALSVNGTPLTLDPNGIALFSSAVPGIFTAEATALDAAGNEGYASATFRFQTAGDTIAPSVTITAPTEGQEITMPVEVRGTVSDDSGILHYRIEASPAGRNQFFTVESGNTPVTDGVLGTFDPTLLLNGMYDLRVVVEDASGNLSTTPAATVRVDGQAKVGLFTISFDDLVVPVSGIPITITRTYDSRNKSRGDFGVGWTLEVKNIEIHESGTLGNHWQQVKGGSLFSTSYTLSPTKPRQVSVRFPSGRLDTFSMVVTPTTQSFLPIQLTTASFKPLDARTTSKLESLNPNQLVVDPPAAGPVTLRTTDFVEYDPDRYRLTELDGTVYVMNQTSGLEKITDRNGNTITFTQSGILHSAGPSVTFTRDSQQRITRITDPAGNAITYLYDSYGDLVAVTDQDGNTTRFRYDHRHNLLDIVDPLGRRAARNEYDSRGRLIAIVDANGKRTEFTHSLGTREEIIKDRVGNLTKHEYDARGNIVATTEVAAGGSGTSRRTTFTYDSRDNLLTQTDPLGNTTSFTYDAKNNLTSRTNALGQTERFTYNARGEVLSRTDAAGRVTANAYDTRGNLTTVTTCSAGCGSEPARVTRFGYDAQGNPVSVTDALGRTSHQQYNALGRLTEMINALGEKTRFGYDGAGNTTAITPPGRPAHRFTYSPSGLETAYAPPPLLAIPDARTLFTYDAAGRLTEIRRPDGLNLEKDYDAVGRLIQQSFPPPYSAAPGVRVVAYTYDDEDRLLSATNASVVVANTYEFKQVKDTTWSGEVGGGVSRRYDAAGRLVEQSVTVGATADTVDFRYDGASRLIGAGALVIGRDPGDGRVTGEVLGVVTGASSYSGAGELAALSAVANGAPVFDVTYDRDVLGRIVRKTETVNGLTQSFSYTYDGAGRLTDVYRDGVFWMAHYEYDANGNRVSGFNQHCPTIVATYDDQDRLLTYTCGPSTTTYTYTPNGELLSKTVDGSATTTYSYDVLGNLLQVMLPDRTNIEYVVDGLNRRIGKKVSPAPGQAPVLTQGFLYDGQLRIVAELDGGGNIVSRFVYGTKINVPEYMVRGGVTYRIITDHLGSPRMVVNAADGTVVQEIEYDEFGVVLSDTNSGFQPFGFAGGLWDADTGLVRFGARDYDAETGRWTTKDPIGFGGGDTNLYGYVLNDPINRIDPLGLTTFGELGNTQAIGGILRGITRHGINQIINRGVGPRLIVDALRNPTLVRQVVDPLGRITFQYIGTGATVVVNTQGLLITAWRLL